MFKNYFKVAIRNLINNKGFSSINIFGFALGIFVCIIISLYVIDDLTYDHQFEEPENLYRVVSNDNSKDWFSAVTVGPLYLLLKDEVPEIEASCRIGGYGARIKRADIEVDDSLAVFRRAMLTNPGFFGVFRPKIICGEMEHPLEDPNGVYLTEDTAEAIFGDEDPVGKALDISYIEDGYVAGIVENTPLNTHLRYGVIMQMDVSINPLWWDSWENLTLTGYIRVENNVIPDEVERKVIEVARANNMATVFTPQLQPLLDMHLKSSELRYDAFNLNKSDISIVYSLILIALLVLMVASINYINLSSARSSKRSKEVGMRKVVGAKRKQLTLQFLGESVFFTIIAMIIALAAVEIALPYLQTFLNKRLEFNLVQSLYIFPGMLVISIVIGILSGIYPAIRLSGFQPIKTLKGEMKSGKKGTILRRILVVSQFSVSIALILSVLIVLSQIKYLQSIDFGYNKDNILIVPAFDENITIQNDLFKEKVLSLPSVISATRARQLPGFTLPTAEVFFDHREGEYGIMTDEIFVDEDFLNTLKIELLFGRNFKKGSIEDSTNSVLINETALRMSGWDDPIGKKIIHVPAEGTDNPLTVIGVVKDIHFGKAKRIIEPMLIHYFPRNNFLLIRINNVNVEETTEQIEEIFTGIWSDRDFRTFPFNDAFNFQFFNERNFVVKVAVFSGLAILIACLGLFGMATFITEQRTKEIGVRKVFGSSVHSVVFLLSKDFAKWVLVSNIFAWPLTYYVMTNWLQNFAYRTEINFWLFLLSGSVALIIAFITVSFHTIKAANSNPVKVLKYE